MEHKKEFQEKKETLPIIFPIYVNLYFIFLRNNLIINYFWYLKKDELNISGSICGYSVYFPKYCSSVFIEHKKWYLDSSYDIWSTSFIPCSDCGVWDLLDFFFLKKVAHVYSLD